MEFARPGLSLAALLTLVCWMAGAGALSAQSRSAIPGMFRCPDCPLSGQTAGSSPEGGDPTPFIPRVTPVFHEGGSFQIALIARVLNASPLLLEELDSQIRIVDRDLKVIETPTDPTGEKSSCPIRQIDMLDLASKPIVATLRFNDLITATVESNRDEQHPDSILDATWVLTKVRRVTGPVAYFQPNPGPGCNRSGRLVEYDGLGNDVVTVYNDGGISYRDPLSRTFRGRLSGDERADLLKAFKAANFNELRAAVPRKDWAKVQAITLLAARYQYVMAEGEAVLALLVQRMRELRLRAMSHTHFLLTIGAPRKIAILPWPYPDVRLAELPMNQPPDPGRSVAEIMRAREARVPDEFFDRLPSAPRYGDPGTDSEHPLYFTEGERLYRVTKSPRCAADDAGCRMFKSLSVMEILGLEAAVRVSARSIHRRIRYSGPTHAVAEGGPVDLALLHEFAIGAYPFEHRWSADLGVSLAAVPPAGVAISLDEFERHRTAFFSILGAGRSPEGMRLIEGDLLFEDVRLCQIEPGVVDDCKIR